MVTANGLTCDSDQVEGTTYMFCPNIVLLKLFSLKISKRIWLLTDQGCLFYESNVSVYVIVNTSGLKTIIYVIYHFLDFFIPKYRKN